MKYLKLYEAYKKKWNSIYCEGDKLYVDMSKLSNEMLDFIDKDPNMRDKDELQKAEKEYCNIIKKLLEGKVISFACADCYPDDIHTGVCEKVSFESGMGTAERGDFSIEFIQIKLEDLKDYHNIEDYTVIVHLNEDPDLYRNANKYNI